MFRRVVHCDWSKNPAGRWGASARWTARGWHADGPWPVGDDMVGFVGRLLAFGQQAPTLAAFDFPIGLPIILRDRMEIGSFPDALDAFGTGEWGSVFDPATVPGEIGIRRPFYPDRPGSALQAHLLAGLGAEVMGDLTRACEKGGEGIPPAGCMFWLVGAKAVGKAAIHGWQNVVRPARAEGARLWPFGGDLAALADAGGLVLAESYPADAGRQLGLTVRGKGNPVVLEAAGSAVLNWMDARRIAPAAQLRNAVETGFAGYGRHCGDAFDAVVGLLAALAVVAGERDAAPRLTEALQRWEGWILGRRGLPSGPFPMILEGDGAAGLNL